MILTLKVARKELKLIQNRLAEKAGTNKRFIYILENARGDI
jgi:DNA-binding XRE family transcriptional regulator